MCTVYLYLMGRNVDLSRTFLVQAEPSTVARKEIEEKRNHEIGCFIELYTLSMN